MSLFFFFSFFLSLTLFFRLTPWSIEALCVHLSTQVSKTWMGRCSASSLPRETGRAPVASVNRASSLSRGFIGFLCKPRNISLFLSSIPLSFIHSFANAVSPSGSPGSCGGWTLALAPWKKSYDQPRQHSKKQRHYFANKGPSSQSCGFSSSHGCESWIRKAEH